MHLPLHPEEAGARIKRERGEPGAPQARHREGQKQPGQALALGEPDPRRQMAPLPLDLQSELEGDCPDPERETAPATLPIKAIDRVSKAPAETRGRR